MNAQPPGAGPTDRIIEVRFLRSGGAYFGIWIVNLLLLLVTLGLYYPWARVRKLQFFAGNTEIDGYPMHFHGVPRRMFGGFLIAAIGFMLYLLGDLLHPLLGLAMPILFALVWPALLRAALRFRLGNTSWRGIRLGFTGTLGEAYATVAVPLIVVAVVLVIGVGAGMSALPGNMEGAAPALAGAAGGITVLLLAVLLPYLHYRIVRYRQSHLAFAGEHSRFEAGAGRFYLLYLVVGVVGSIGAGMTVPVVAGLSVWLGDGEFAMASDALGATFIGIIALTLFVGWHLVRALVQAWLFNLTWRHTRSGNLRCRADLSILSLFLVRLTNSLMLLVTLGLYTPFAEVRLARLLRSSLTVLTRADLDELVDTAARERLSAASDAAADIFDMDIGL